MKRTIIILAIVLALLIVPSVMAQDTETDEDTCVTVQTFNSISMDWCAQTGIIGLVGPSGRYPINITSYSAEMPVAFALTQTGAVIQFESGHLEIQFELRPGYISISSAIFDETPIMGIANSSFSNFFCVVTLTDGYEGWQLAVEQRGFPDPADSCDAVTLDIESSTGENIINMMMGN